METTLKEIQQNKTDYKVCDSCGQINCSTNSKCFNCKNTMFNDNVDNIIESNLTLYSNIIHKVNKIEIQVK
jgi:hypothetical protein